MFLVQDLILIKVKQLLKRSNRPNLEALKEDKWNYVQLKLFQVQENIHQIIELWKWRLPNLDLVLQNATIHHLINKSNFQDLEIIL